MFPQKFAQQLFYKESNVHVFILNGITVLRGNGLSVMFLRVKSSLESTLIQSLLYKLEVT